MKIVQWYGKLVECGIDAETLLRRTERAERAVGKLKQKNLILKNTKEGQAIKYKIRFTECHA